MSAPVTQAHLDYWRERQKDNRQFAALARAALDPIVRVLATRFGARRIILFGSLASGRFTAESDIDLAVEGIAPEDFFAALAEVNRDAPAWVDLKPLEDLEPRFRERVLSTGECVYAREIEQ
jgi:predicted nucleotidyltransferase